jgi:hypothetical protein
MTVRVMTVQRGAKAIEGGSDELLRAIDSFARTRLKKSRFACAEHTPALHADGRLVQPHICSKCGWELDDMLAR